MMITMVLTLPPAISLRFAQWDTELRHLAERVVGDQWAVKEGITASIGELDSLVKSAAAEGSDKGEPGRLAAVVAVGGDGTMHQVGRNKRKRERMIAVS